MKKIKIRRLLICLVHINRNNRHSSDIFVVQRKRATNDTPSCIAEFRAIPVIRPL